MWLDTEQMMPYKHDSVKVHASWTPSEVAISASSQSKVSEDEEYLMSALPHPVGFPANVVPAGEEYDRHHYLDCTWSKALMPEIR